MKKINPFKRILLIFLGILSIPFIYLFYFPYYFFRTQWDASWSFAKPNFLKRFHSFRSFTWEAEKTDERFSGRDLFLLNNFLFSIQVLIEEVFYVTWLMNLGRHFFFFDFVRIDSVTIKVKAELIVNYLEVSCDKMDLSNLSANFPRFSQTDLNKILNSYSTKCQSLIEDRWNNKQTHLGDYSKEKFPQFSDYIKAEQEFEGSFGQKFINDFIYQTETFTNSLFDYLENKLNAKKSV